MWPRIQGHPGIPSQHGDSAPWETGGEFLQRAWLGALALDVFQLYLISLLLKKNYQQEAGKMNLAHMRDYVYYI